MIHIRCTQGGQDRVAVECPHPNQEDVGLNLTATRNEKWCPNGSTGSK